MDDDVRESASELEKSTVSPGGAADAPTGSTTSGEAADTSLSETIRYEAPEPQATVIGSASLGTTEPSMPAIAGSRPSRFGDYELLHEIARGGMGIVFRARQVKLNRVVAIKMILAGQFASGEDIQRFYAEAEAAANLDHPGIVPIYEVGEIDGQHFFSMGYVDGPSLSKKLQNGPLPPRDAAALVQTVAEAVHYAHQHNIVHRDLKPQNILLTADGHPKVTDFGLAKTVEGDHGLTASGQVLGTPGYMPPEQAAGKVHDIGPLSDVYSLGAVLYCLLTGRPPFQSANVLETLKQVVEREPVSPRLLNPAVDRDLETICLKCLSKEPSQRLASAQEVALELGRFLRGEPIRSRRVGPLTRMVRWCQRNKLATALAASFLILVALSGLTYQIVKESGKTRQIAKLSEQFETLLDQPSLDAGFTERGASLLAALAAVAPERAEADRERLWQTFAQHIEAGIRREKLTAADEKQLQAALERLSSAREEEAGRLKKLLAGRQRTWQPVFALAAPFANRADVFDASAVELANERLLPRGTSGATAKDSRPIPARETAAGDVRAELALDPSWEKGAEAGISFRYDERARYQFLVKAAPMSAPTAADPNARAETFEAVRALGGSLAVQILRNDVVLREQTFPLRGLEGAELRLTAQRQGDRLEFQVGKLATLSFDDMFAIRSRQPVQFEVVWPAGVGLSSLRAFRRPRAETVSPLERADELFAAGQFDEALAQYQQTATAAKDPEVSQEARYKEALCRLQLNQRPEAAAILEPLSVEPGQRWPVVATIQWWLILIRERKLADAEALFERISTTYSFAQLAALIPQEMRSEVLEVYGAQRGSRTARSLAFDPQKIAHLERLLLLQQLFGHDPSTQLYLRLEIVDAHWAAGNAELAYRLLDELYRNDPFNGAVLQRYLQSLFLRGNAAEALKVVDGQLFDDRGRPRRDAGVWNWLSRARCHAWLGQPEAAEQDLAEFQHTVGRIDLMNAGQVALLRGLLLEQRGQTAAAREAWRAGITEDPQWAAIQAVYQETFLMHGLSGDLELKDAEVITSKLQGAGAGTVARMAQSLLNPATLLPAARAMFRTIRGRDLTWKLAANELFTADEPQALAVLFGHEFLRQGAFGGVYSPEQDEVFWQVAVDLHRALTRDGTLTAVQAGQLGLTWKGTTNLLGWGGMAPTLPPALRGPIAYGLAHRMLRLNKPADAANMLRTAAADAAPDSKLQQLAKRDLELLQAAQGIVILTSEVPEPVEIEVLANEAVLQMAVVAGRLDLVLPQGDYRLRIKTTLPDRKLSAEQVTLSACGRRIVNIDWTWAPGTIQRPFPGPVARPAAHPEFSRWQIATRWPLGTWQNPVALHPSGTQYAIGSFDGLVRVYDAADERLVAAFPGHSSRITGIAWSPDGRRLLSGSRDRAARIWNLADRTAGAGFFDHLDEVRVIAWGPGANSATSGSWSDLDLHLWNTDGVPERKLPVKGVAASLAWSPNGEWLATTDGSPNIQLWKHSGEAGPTLSGHAQAPFQLAWRPDGAVLASGGADQQVRLSNAGTGLAESVWQIETPVFALAWSSSGDRLAVGRSDGVLQVRRAPQGEVQWSRPLSRNIQGLAWSQDDRQVLSIGNWPGHTGTTAADGSADTFVDWRRQGFLSARLSPDGKRILLAGILRAEIWSTDGELLATLPEAVYADRPIVWSPDGRRIATARHSGEAVIYDAGTGAIAATVAAQPGVARVYTWSSDSTALAVDTGKTIRVWHADGAPETVIENLPREIRTLGWQPGGDWLTILFWDDPSALHAWNARTRAEGATLRVPQGCSPNGLRWRPDGRQLAIFSDDGRVFLLNHEGLLTAMLEGHRGIILDAAWSPDQTRFATTSHDGTCRIWQTDGTPVAVCRRHVSWPEQPVFTTDNEVVSWGLDQTVRTWNAGTGEQARMLLVAEKESVLLGAGGNVISASPRAWEQFVYLGEKPSGEIAIVEAAEFHRGLGVPLPEADLEDSPATPPAGSD